MERSWFHDAYHRYDSEAKGTPMSREAVQKYDLTTGGIAGKLFLVAIPIMGTQLMQMAYNLTDMFWLGRVGSDVVAASGTAGMYLWLSQGPLFIGRMGAEIGVAQCLGQEDEASAKRFSHNALVLATVLGVLFGAMLLLLHTPLIGFFNLREQHVASDAATYLFITAIGVPATYLSGAVAGTFNGSGNSRTPFFIQALGLTTNMILDPLLILTVGWGIVGAAVATVIAQILVCVISLLMLRWNRFSPFSSFRFLERPHMETIRQIVRWSTPVCFESMLFTILSMMTSRFIAAFGADAIAAQRVSTQVESLSWLIAGGFSTAVTAYVGQNYGAGKWDRVKAGYRMSVLLMLAWGIIVTLILIFLGETLFRLFLQEPHLVALGVRLLKILAVCQISGTLEAAAAGFFRGMGRTIPPSVVSITGNALRVPLAYVLSLTSLGVEGVCWGISIGAIVRGFWIFFWSFAAIRRQGE